MRQLFLIGAGALIPVLVTPVFLISQTHKPPWQQKIHYLIDAELDIKQRTVYGKQRIIYTNNSPDTLKVLYLHVYANAFKKNSFMESYQIERNQFEGGSIISYLNERYLGFNKVRDIRDEDYGFLDFSIDDTIIKIILEKPLLPGTVQTFYLDFELKIPFLLRRMGWRNREGIEFSMAQWYPKVCVYDQKGWHTNYYLGREFYGEFATFDVSITLPEEYIVGASGSLRNATDIHEMMKRSGETTGHDRLVITRDSSAKSGPSVNMELESLLAEFDVLMKEKQIETKRRTWLYHAENVHDFAWCADPDYIYESVEHEGVRIHLLYQPDVAEKWKEMKTWTSRILSYMNDYVGKYPYTDFTIAQAGDGGMEYPNIVFITGDRDKKSLASVTAHEMVHNWFYGMMANNETLEGWLDEGVTSYYTTRLMEHLFGRYANIDYDSRFKQKWFPKEDARIATYTGLDMWIKQGYEEKVLQHSDFFQSDRSHLYSVYYKGEIFMFVLEYYFGRERLDELIRKFFGEWRLHHVYTEDMQRYFEMESGIELDWLFEEWLNTTDVCDYAIKKSGGRWLENKESYEAEIILIRRGRIEMPVDVTVTLVNDSSLTYRIPAHSDDPDIRGFERKPVWNKVSSEYLLYLDLPDAVKLVEIDTTLLLPDIHRMNNRTGLLPKTEWHFQMPVGRPATLNTYVIEHRPSMWYNATDVLRGGYQFNGKWATDEHKVKAGVYYGIDSRKVDYEFSYSTPLYRWGRQLFINMGSYRLEGRAENRFSLTKRIYNSTLYRPPINDFSIGYRSGYLFDSHYLPPGILWDKKRIDVVSMGWTLQTKLYNSPKLKTNLETSAFGSRWHYSKLYMAYRHPLALVKKYLSATPYMFGGYSTGNVPVQELYYIAGASPRQMFDNKFYRSRGTIPDGLWQSSGSRHVNYDGDGSMSGYADSNLFGSKIFVINLDLNCRNPFKFITQKSIFFLTQFEPYVFYDIGLLWNDDAMLKKNIRDYLLMDAGSGFFYPLPIPSWIGNYRLKCDFPVWVNKPERNGKSRRIAFRWMVGLANEF